MFISQFVRKFVRRQAVAAGISLAAATVGGVTPARAASFEFEGTNYDRAGGLVVPCIKVRFNPTPDSTSLQVRLSPDSSARPVLTNYNRGGNSFGMLLSMEDGHGNPVRLFPPGPCRDGACLNYFVVNGLAADGTPYIIRVDVSSPNGNLDPASLYEFNPQPEPPGFPAALEVDFRIASTTAATASTTITVLSGSRVVPLQ